MIDSKELHIGSHVLIDGVRARVIRIDEPMKDEIPKYTLLRFKAFIDGEWRECGGPADSGKVEPIPITAELLTELGFGCIARYNESWWQRDNKRIKIKGNYVEVEVYQGFYDATWRCVYLHELEAFLYLTTKTELIKEE